MYYSQIMYNSIILRQRIDLSINNWWWNESTRYCFISITISQWWCKMFLHYVDLLVRKAYHITEVGICY